MKLKEELSKVFRTIYCYQWALKYYDINNGTAYSMDYMTDVLNYLATGTQDVSCILDAKEEMDEPDDGLMMAESMMFNTVEYIDSFLAKMEEVDNKASKKSII
jgi:hypothetical protein